MLITLNIASVIGLPTVQFITPHLYSFPAAIVKLQPLIVAYLKDNLKLTHHLKTIATSIKQHCDLKP